MSVDIFEPPQTDVTRCFMTMRVDFERPLRIERARENLRLISLDTSQQRLRYEQFGYTDSKGRHGAVSIRMTSASLPLIDRLAKNSPLVALSGNRTRQPPGGKQRHSGPRHLWYHRRTTV